jgi:hypothetical protein
MAQFPDAVQQNAQPRTPGQVINQPVGFQGDKLAGACSARPSDVQMGVVEFNNMTVSWRRVVAAAAGVE